MAKSAEHPKVAVIGAGPIGLEVALQATELGWPVTVYEQGEVGNFISRWGFVRMFTPFGMNVSTLGMAAIRADQPRFAFPPESELLTGHAYRDAYLLPLANSTILADTIRTNCRLLSVGRSQSAKPGKEIKWNNFRLLFRCDGGQEKIETANLVFDCTGKFGNPNWIGDGQMPAAGELAARSQLCFQVEDILGEKRGHYAGKSVVVLGSGYSAATVVADLATLAEEEQSTWVIWLTRGARTQPLPRIQNDPIRERDKLAAKANALATRCDGNLEYHPMTLIDEVIAHGPDQGVRLSGRVAGKPMSWDVERVIAAIGDRPDWTIAPYGRSGLSRTLIEEPGYYPLGAKSFERGPQTWNDFFLKDGYDQVARLFGQLRKDHASPRSWFKRAA